MPANLILTVFVPVQLLQDNHGQNYVMFLEGEHGIRIREKNIGVEDKGFVVVVHRTLFLSCGACKNIGLYVNAFFASNLQNVL